MYPVRFSHQIDFHMECQPVRISHRMRATDFDIESRCYVANCIARNSIGIAGKKRLGIRKFVSTPVFFS